VGECQVILLFLLGQPVAHLRSASRGKAQAQRRIAPTFAARCWCAC